MKNAKTRDMTQGNIWKHLIFFAIPLILGNLFQLTYNAVDSIVVGRIAGDAALAAVGTADPVMNLLILGITGTCIGASVIMSNCFGAGDHVRLKNEMGTSLILGGILSAVVLVGGLIFSRKILQLMKTPDEILDDAVRYLRIIFIGMPFTCLYNIYAAALRSVGDSKTPVRFLAVSSILNILMDLLFIAVFRMGVVGAALATVIAEALSALFCLIYVYRKVPVLHIGREQFRFHKDLFLKTLSYGGATALQQCSQPVGKLFIQGMVNTLGVSTIAAFNAVGKIEDFALVPERSISNAMMTFGAQNDGAGKEQRIRQGLWTGLALETLYYVFICAVILLFRRPLLSLFSESELTLAEGMKYFGIMAFFYILPGFTNGLQGFFRGLGNMRVTLYGTLIQITGRVIVTSLLIRSMGITGVAYACAAGWICMLCLQIPYTVHLLKKRRETKAAAG